MDNTSSTLSEIKSETTLLNKELADIQVNIRTINKDLASLSKIENELAVTQSETKEKLEEAISTYLSLKEQVDLDRKEHGLVVLSDDDLVKLRLEEKLRKRQSTPPVEKAKKPRKSPRK